MIERARRWRWLLPAAGAAAVLALALRPRPVRVEVVALERGPMRVTVDEEGRTQVKRRYVVSAPVEGRLLRIALQAGDPVSEGDPVATVVPVDAPLLDPRTRSEQEARLEAAQEGTAQANAAVARARIAEANARSELERKRRLAAASAISQAELEAAETDAASRAQELAGSESGAKIAEHQLTQARAALSPGRLAKHDGLAILAPAPGRVLRVAHESEGVVMSGATLMEIGDPGTIEIATDLLTVDAVKVRPGMPALVDHWGGAVPLAARVRTVEPSGFTKVSALGVEEQRVRVILDLVDPSGAKCALADNFRVEVHIAVWQREGVLRIPATALFHRGDTWAAMVAKNGRLRERRLEVGEQSAELAEVRGGLEPGELVVLHPGDSLTEGMSVEPVVEAR